ncbi:hypothetical protein [Pseudomonas putida]|uniref:Uncharacterized protein n=1 Tax=Pseudomonas putida TaxID=303 RepID=A0A8I1EHL6_PSEPU|nr:hypothetical protein [Pseudomonas putida]MBI6885781.1 hypothetical protein [Pseudomonas putida]
MLYVSNKGEVASLLDSQLFVKLLGIQSREQFESLTPDEAENGQYFENMWDEADQTRGVVLVSTDRGAFYGSKVFVAKLYGEPELPYRVVYSEVVPWGTEMDPDLVVGDFKTLGEALDMLIETHQKAKVSLNRIVENEAIGLYVKGMPEASLPDAPAPTKSDKARHALFDQAVQASVEEWAKVPEPELAEEGLEAPVVRRPVDEGASPSF